MAKRIAIEKIPDFGRTLLQDCFQVELLERMKSQDLSNITGPKAISSMLAKTVEQWREKLKKHYDKTTEHGDVEQMLKLNPDGRHLLLLMQWLYKGNLLSVQPRVDGERAYEISRDYNRITCEVVASKVRMQFAVRATQVFLGQLQQHGEEIWKFEGNRPLNIGLVSGSTVESVIEILENSENWERDFGVDASIFGKINVIAVNVCLTHGDELSWNANVLVYRLVRAIKRQKGYTAQATAYGLSAPLTVGQSHLKEIDNGYETRKVIEITQPSRLQEDSTAGANADAVEETNLDIILTSVGSADESLFWSCSKDLGGDKYQIDVDRIKSAMAGDIIYTPVNPQGKEIEMNAFVVDPKEAKSTKKEKIIFYSAINLTALKYMARQKSEKSVILLAREKKKTAAVKAALNGRYASILVTDEDCAEDL